ncbi:MAG TPA: TetR/AcrR family transcriptional regulator [Bauldia sp.]|nr:TetR/AcrR family transcriptional regulator [Bauldia sp.]
MSIESHPTDGRKARGERSRRSILEAAATLASVEGLEGLSLGRLADHLGISKSGLYAHFGSKEELQLATIGIAAEMYGRDVMAKALEADAGTAQIVAFADAFLHYIRHGPFPGGCFFIASFLDPANIREPVRQALADVQRQLLGFFAANARIAQKRGDLSSSVDPEELAFEVDAILVGADVNYILFNDPMRLERAKDAVRRLVGVAPRRPARGPRHRQ